MPSAQVINFGEDPYANAMGGFAKNFLGTLNEKTAQKRNENIFSKIKEKYSENAEPEKIFRDVLEAEGLDQEYKRNKLNEIKDLATLSTKNKINPYQKAMLDIRNEELGLKKKKATKEDGLSEFQRKNLSLQKTRLDLERERLDQAAAKDDKKLPEYIDKYTGKLLKDSEVKLPPHLKSELNGFVEQLMLDKENPLGINDAFGKAYEYIQAVEELIENVDITPRPTSWIGQPSSQELEDNLDQAVQELQTLHDESGIENQKDLRTIAERAGWHKDEITKMIQLVFQRNGKKMRGPKSAEQSAEIPFQEQGVASQVGGLDDILFGE